MGDATKISIFGNFPSAPGQRAAAVRLRHLDILGIRNERRHRVPETTRAGLPNSVRRLSDSEVWTADEGAAVREAKRIGNAEVAAAPRSLEGKAPKRKADI